ncbi:hypothetical protein [Vreelandella venusta]|uniref:hypothetical protein n=1 Tax=Vreelandella venusta TaxID=44935 RepID=UPI0018DA7B12|nr:hypothetical protein [Halomonas venusta]QPI65442.1 hypothetical protein IR195_07005 [Halomonas venusta]
MPQTDVSKKRRPIGRRWWLTLRRLQQQSTYIRQHIGQEGRKAGIFDYRSVVEPCEF